MSNESKIVRNEGVIANNVSAQALSSGQNSQATVNYGSIKVEQFQSSVAELKRAVESLKLPENAKASISEHVSHLEEEAKKPSPDRNRVQGALEALSSSVKLLGEFVSNAKVILGPVLAIAALFGFTIS